MDIMRLYHKLNADLHSTYFIRELNLKMYSLIELINSRFINTGQIR